nr:immunoglobulin heavy chain junction region [Mus musculus]
CTWLRAYW